MGAHGSSEGRWLASPRLRAPALREAVTVAVGLRLHGQQASPLRPTLTRTLTPTLTPTLTIYTLMKVRG